MDVSGRGVGGVDVSLTWSGVAEFNRFLRETPGVVRKDLEAVLTQEGENVMGISVINTPVDFGPLRASGHAKPAVTKGGKTSVTLAYGEDYAFYVHESGPRAGGQGEKKFLENAVNRNAKGYTDRLRRRVLARIGAR